MGETTNNSTNDNAANIKSNIVWGLIGFIAGVVVAFGIFSMTMGSAAKSAADQLGSANAADTIQTIEVEQAAV